jgi:flagellar basal body-associated protein FliL
MKHKNIWIIIAEVLTIVVVVLGGILVAKYRKSSETKAQVEVSHYSCNSYGLPEETGCDDTEVEKHDARVGVTFEIKELELVKFLIT